MARTAIATLQPVWDCRWSRPGHRLSGVSDALQPESAWLCVRDGNRRNASEDECQTCPHWELDAGGGAALIDAGAIAATVRHQPVDVIGASVRTLLAVIALTFFALGFSILTSLLAIPVTVTLWTSGAAFAALAVWWRLPEN
ncbi:MAG TPA: hypothetical protein VFV95_17270 [Vicinamibacterales bacterium]|nr:hypothetical protein [Vicinamibacterales bacterium]